MGWYSESYNRVFVERAIFVEGIVLPRPPVSHWSILIGTSSKLSEIEGGGIKVSGRDQQCNRRMGPCDSVSNRPALERAATDPTSTPSSEKLPYNFFGLHLRVESDWTYVNGSLTEEHMIKQVFQHNTTKFPVLYTACGEATKLKQFKQLASKLGVVVVDKWDLIEAADRKRMDELWFDQLGILDFVVLRHAQFFWGFGGSSFSHALALWRHMNQFGNMHYQGEDYQSKLMGPKWVQPLLYDILW